MISNSVGFGMENKKEDVELVQTLLNKYISSQKTPCLMKLEVDGKCGHKTITAIKFFQIDIRAMANPDGRVDMNGKTIRALSRYQTNVLLKKAALIDVTDPRKLKTREQTAEAYGGISNTKIWANANKFLAVYNIDSEILNDPSFHCIEIYTPGKRKLKSFSCHVAMHPFLSKAFANLKSNKLLSELKEFGGCHSIRATRGANYWSAHSWGLAIDVNVSENGLGVEPKLSKKFVESFKDAGFGWGGEYKRKDGMHFTIAGFDMPKGERD